MKKERDALRVAARSSSTRRKVPLHNIKDIYREFYTRLEKADKDDIATPAQEAADAVLEYLEGMDIATDILAIEALVNTYAITVEEEAFSNGFKAAALLLDREETAKC